MRAIIFDVETTGLLDNRTVHIDKQPHVIEFCGQVVDLATGDVLEFFSSLIKPSLPVDLDKPVKGTKSIKDITGISNEMIADAPSFKSIAIPIMEMISGAEAAIAHNLSFDKEMTEIELERLGLKAAWPKRMICTVEQTIHLRGHRLNLTKLHGLLFPAETFTPHRAGSDVAALTKCAIELFRREII